MLWWLCVWISSKIYNIQTPEVTRLGLKPRTSGTGILRSIQLSYQAIDVAKLMIFSRTASLFMAENIILCFINLFLLYAKCQLVLVYFEKYDSKMMNFDDKSCVYGILFVTLRPEFKTRNHIR